MPDQPTNPQNDPVAIYLNSRSAIYQAREVRVERQAVRKIAKAAGLKNATITTFAGLVAAGFPMQLVSASLSRRGLSAILNDLMLRPTRSEVYTAYTDALQQFPDFEGSLGIVFNWRNSSMVFHDLDTSVQGDFGFFVRINDRHFRLEKLSSLMTCLGASDEW